MLSPLGPLLADAKRSGKAIGSFNAVCVEFVDGITQAAEEARRPIIVALSESHLKFIDMETFLWAVRSRSERVHVPVSAQFDHAQSPEAVEEALKAGFPSVMFDGKGLSYEDKVWITAELVKMSHVYGAVMEAPLGTIGSTGKEESEFTDPDMVEDFVARTGVDILAASVGTVHGLSQGEAHLDFERLKKICDLAKRDISLHGGSGVRDQEYGRAVGLGVNKVSIFTRLSQAGVRAVQDVMTREKYRYPDFLPATRAAVKTTVSGLLERFVSAGAL